MAFHPTLRTHVAATLAPVGGAEAQDMPDAARSDPAFLAARCSVGFSGEAR